MAADPFDALAAELVRGSQERFVAELTERMASLLAQGCESPDRLAVLARLSRSEALAVWSEWEGRVTGGCAAAFAEALDAEDESIVGSLRELSPSVAYDTAYGTMVAAEAARGMAEIMRRQNVALCDALADAWYRITADAVTAVESGGSRREAMERGCAALADAGLETVDYASGVRTAVDAALRRHLVTQWNQARNDLLMRRMDEWGCDLVFTSAHFGARPTHAVWQGRVFSRSGSSPDYPPLVESTGYGTVTGLCGANCVIEGTLVSGPLATAAYRREYAGEVVRIRTALGHDLTVTPNHPVLTGRGWVPANEVEQGDHVFSRVFRDGMPLGVRPDEQEREPTVEQEFHALGDSFGVGALLGSPADFHGDGILDQQVDVVLVDGGLMGDLQPTATKHAPKPLLLDAARLSGPGFSGGPVDEVVVRAAHAANGVVGVPAQLGPLLGAHAGHPRAHGLAWALGHDADAFEPVRDGRLGDAERLGDGGLVHPAIPEVEHATGVNGLSPAVDLKTELSELIGDEGLSAGEMSPHLPDGRTFLVETDEVVDIDRGTWSGHVYNLSTLGGWYFANGIVTHNCRHAMTPYVEGHSQLPDTDWSEQERLTGMTSDEYYEATQRQRRYEAAIRRTKREIAVGRGLGLDMVDRRVLLGRQQARVRQWCAEKGLRRDYERERAYGAGAQPRHLSPSYLASRKAKTVMFEGSFGEATSEARSVYMASNDLTRTMYDRIGIRPDIGHGILKLTQETRVAIMSGIEHGVSFVGGHARNFKFVTTGTLEKGVIAQAERRGDDLVIRISASRIRGRSMDDVEQILFHEVAHTAEWRFTTAEQWERETGRLTRWRKSGRGELKISRSSAIIEETLASSGFRVGYDPLNGSISLGEDAYNEASKISNYAVRDADRGDQDSELMAECIRFVALNGRGANRVADVVVGVLLDGY